MSEAFERRYAAFISYRHADNREAGRRWAEWLHQVLETYQVPRDLVGKPNEAGQPIPASLYPVFRDEEELPADADLSHNIQRALEHSDSLIVLCSPRACESHFVADEIRFFKERGGSDRVLALMIDGEPNADDPAKATQGILPTMECFPGPLRTGVRREDGTIDWELHTEPLAADVRPGNAAEQGYTSAAAYRAALEKGGHAGREVRTMEKAFAEQLELARLKIIAGCLRLPLGVLRKRDAVYRAKRLRLLASIFGAITLVALIAGAVAWWQRGVARHQLERMSLSDHAVAEQALREGEWRKGVAYLGRSLENDPQNLPAMLHLWSALTHGASERAAPGPDDRDANTGATDRDPLPARVVTFAPPARAALARTVVSPDGRRLAVYFTDEPEALHLWDLEAGRTMDPPLHLAKSPQISFSPDGRWLLVMSEGTEVWEAASGRHVGALPVRLTSDARFGPDGRVLLLGEKPRWFDLTSAREFESKLPPGVRLIDAQLTTRGWSVIAQSAAKEFTIFDADTGAPRGPKLSWPSPIDQTTCAGPVISPDGQWVAFVEHKDLRDSADNFVAAKDEALYLWALDSGIATALQKSHAEVSPPDVADFHRASDFEGGVPFVTREFESAPDLLTFDAHGKLPNGGRLHPGNEVGETFLFDPGSAHLLTRFDGQAMLHDLAQREAPGVPLEEGEKIEQAIFVGNGQALAAKVGPSSYQVWEVATGQKLQSFAARRGVVVEEGGREVMGFGFGAPSFEEEKSAVHPEPGAADPARVIPIFAEGKPVAFALSHPEAQTLRFLPERHEIVTIGPDGTARSWNPPALTPAEPPERLNLGITSVSFTPGREWIVVQRDAGVEIFDPQTRERIGEAHAGHTNATGSDDGRRLFTVTSEGEKSLVHVWDLTRKPFAEVTFPIPAPQNLFTDAHGTSLLIVGEEKQEVWDVDARSRRSELQSLESSPRAEWPGEGLLGPSKDPALSPDGTRVVWFDEGGRAVLWDAASGQALGDLLPGGGYRFVFSPDSRRILFLTYRGPAELWDLTARRKLAELRHDNQIRVGCFSADSRRVLTIGEQNLARVWDSTTGREKHELPTAHRWTWHPVLTQDGRWLLSRTEGVRVRDTMTGRAVIEETGEWSRDWSSALAPSGRWLASSSPTGAVHLTQLGQPRLFATWLPKFLRRGQLDSWMADLVASASGLHFTDAGDLREVPIRERLEMRERLSKVKAQDPEWERLLEWWLKPEAERPAAIDAHDFLPLQPAE